MQNTYNLKFLELQKLNNGIDSCKCAINNIEEKINYVELLDGTNLLVLERENLQQELNRLEADKEKLNEELINNEGLSELIKIKYVFLMSNYAAFHHDNPQSKPKNDAQTFIQKIFNFNKIKK